ncbi:MAG: hypothetical protein EOO39_47845 [Cytophagaceae bacterium]|nr:MAG: hypothetical protein EOO39_47845 [Cytophagaceae bacterium]
MQRARDGEPVLQWQINDTFTLKLTFRESILPMFARPRPAEGQMALVGKFGFCSGVYGVLAKRWLFWQYYTAELRTTYCLDGLRDYGVPDPPPPGKAPRRYRTQAAAKAACERHYLTWKWDGAK